VEDGPIKSAQINSNLIHN